MSQQESQAGSRPYRMRARAESAKATRNRILDAVEACFDDDALRRDHPGDDRGALRGHRSNDPPPLREPDRVSSMASLIHTSTRMKRRPRGSGRRCRRSRRHPRRPLRASSATTSCRRCPKRRECRGLGVVDRHLAANTTHAGAESVFAPALERTARSGAQTPGLRNSPP